MNWQIILPFSNMGVTVLFGSVSLISSVVLSTEDSDTEADLLYYVVLTIPEKGYLQLKQGNLPGVSLLSVYLGEDDMRASDLLRSLMSN